MELSLVRNIKDDKKGFCKHRGDKRKTMENVGPLLNNKRNVVTQNREKAEVLKAFFVLVFPRKTGFLELRLLETRGTTAARNMYP